MDGKFVPTTFVAELVDRFYTITFDANVPSGRDVKGLPSPIVVKHGQKARVPFGITLSYPDYKFTGEWNDDKDGEGASYQAGSKIRNVFSHMTLYAQWERVTATASEAKETTGVTAPSCGEKTSLGGDLSGSEVTTGASQEKELVSCKR